MNHSKNEPKEFSIMAWLVREVVRGSGWALKLTLVTAGLIALGACGEATRLVATEELVIVDESIAYGLDPADQWGGYYLRGAGAAEGLTRFAPDGEAIPELAESVTAIDLLIWEVKLRPNVHFWSGTPVDAEAVKASLERSRRLDAEAAALLDGIRIEVMDPTTLHFFTKDPNPMLPITLANYPLVIYNAASYGEQPNPLDLQAMDLTGMFRVTSFTPRQEMVLEANNAYWGPKPQVGRIRLLQVTDSQARLLAAQDGRTHIVGYFPPEGVAELEHTEGMNIVTVPADNIVSVYLNLRSLPLGDVRVRQALSWAIDRQELVDLANEGLGQPAPSWLASNPAYPDAAKQGYTRYDFALATVLLDEAGWKLDSDGIRKREGQPLTLRLLSWGIEKPVAEVLQSQWAKVGVVVEVQHSDDYGMILTRRNEGNWEALIEGWENLGDLLTIASVHFEPGGAINYGGYDDASTNALIDRLSKTFDEADRRKLLLQINTRASEMVPIIPLFARPRITAVSTQVEGFQPHPRQGEYLVTASLRIKK